jgi:hypothetical protein
VNSKSAAAKIRKIADGYASKYAGYPDDASYQKMLATDSEDLRYIASLIESGDLPTAVRKVELLDTAVREEIPDTVMRLLYDAD